MFRLALVALLATSACRESLEDNGGAPDGEGGRACNVVTSNPACVMAEQMTAVPLTWIEQNIFTPNCGSASCHSPGNGGGNPGGRIVLTTGSYSKLVNVDATFAAGRKLVVPGSINQSYLMVLVHGVALSEAEPPATAPSGDRYMPLGSPAICCQKIDAIGRWIMAGAMNN